MQYMNLRPSQVILDPQNPRLPDGTSDDREAINRLLDDGLISLARHMARTGQANPAELPIAVKEGNRYLILEGNRRFAALKLLKDPALAYEEEHEKAMRRAAALGTPPRTVYSLVMSSRDEADQWIVLRHTGENNGVGIKRWSASQTATHRRRANKTIDSGTLRSIVIADQLEEAFAADGEIVELVRRLRREKLTNIGRFFSPDVLAALHFTLTADASSSLQTRTLLVRHTSEQLRAFFAWALAFILEKPVDAYKNATIRQTVLQSGAHLLPDLADGSTEPFRLVDKSAPSSDAHSSTSAAPWSEAGAASTSSDRSDTNSRSESPKSSSTAGATPPADTAPTNNGDQERSRPRASEARPEKYLFQGLRLPRHPERVQRLLKECRSLDLDEYPGIACVMVRVIVELSVSSPQALALSGDSESSSLAKKILSMLRHFDPDIENPRKRQPDLAQAYLEVSQLGIQYLNSFVHNPSVSPDQHLARRFSKAFRPLLLRADAEL